MTQADVNRLRAVVKNRVLVHEELVRLYQIQRQFAAMDASPEDRTVLVALTGIGFSLWRATFLGLEEASIDGGSEGLPEGAESFLLKLVQNNSVNYPQDEAARVFARDYYLGNARLRLDELLRTAPDLLGTEDLLLLEQLNSGTRSLGDQWELCFRMLGSVVNNLTGESNADADADDGDGAAEDKLGGASAPVFTRLPERAVIR